MKGNKLNPSVKIGATPSANIKIKSEGNAEKPSLKRPADGLHACWTTATMGEQEARTRTGRLKSLLHNMLMQLPLKPF